MTTSILLSCDNHGCPSQDYHKLDVESDKVFCTGCSREIKSVSKYMKKTLAQNKQIFTKAKSANEMTCGSCKFTGEPVLLEDDNGKFQVACSKCKTVDRHLTNYFIEPLKLSDTVRRIKLSNLEADGVTEKGLVKFGDVEDDKLEEDEAPEFITDLDKSIRKNHSWLSPKKEDRGPSPDEVVASNRINVDENSVKGILAPKSQVDGGSKRVVLPSGADLLKRSGNSLAVQDHDDEETALGSE